MLKQRFEGGGYMILLKANKQTKMLAVTTVSALTSHVNRGFSYVVKFIKVCLKTFYVFTCQQTTTSEQWKGKLRTFVLQNRTNIVACLT